MKLYSILCTVLHLVWKWFVLNSASIPRKCINHPDNLLNMCRKWHFVINYEIWLYYMIIDVNHKITEYHVIWGDILRFKSLCIVNGFAVCISICFLYNWDSRTSKNIYIYKEWRKCESFMPRQKNVVWYPLVHSGNIIIPTLNMKLSLFPK